MTISSSLAAKAGIGVATGVAGTASVYYAFQHFSKDSLYEVEKEVINNEKLKLTVGAIADKKIKIEAPVNEDAKKDESKLVSGHKWICEITLDDSIEVSNQGNLHKYIKSHLQIDGQDLDKKQLENKELLVGSCSKNRATKSDTSVSGKLIISKKGSSGNELTFTNHSELDFLLSRNEDLYLVEKEILSRKVKLTAEKIIHQETK